MGYLRSTRHPWPCLFFVLPLLLVYEVGVLSLGTDGESLRTGADVFLRDLLTKYGVSQTWILPVGLVALLLIWTRIRWKSRPKDGMGLWLGMALESVAFALVLWVLQRNFNDLWDRLIGLAAGLSPDREAVRMIVTYTGAGIYEEVLFRLILSGGIATILRLLFVPSFMAIPFAMSVSSVVFAAAHLDMFVANGEAWDVERFAFRVAAGLFFAGLFHFRGIGIAVGAHVLYDLIVGVPWG